MALFKNNTKNQNMSERQKLTARYNGARNNILLVVAFTLVNSVLLVAGSDSYFLFSAAIPYYLTMFGMVYTGRMPDEYYVGWEDFSPVADSFFIVTLVVAVVIVAFYALTWFLSKKHGYGWLIAALLIFVADTFAMFYFTGFTADMIMDFVFHAWVLISLTSGVIAAINLKKLPEEEPYLAQEGQTYSYITQAEMPVENAEVAAPVEAPVETIVNEEVQQ